MIKTHRDIIKRRDGDTSAKTKRSKVMRTFFASYDTFALGHMMTM